MLLRLEMLSHSSELRRCWVTAGQEAQACATSERGGHSQGAAVRPLLLSSLLYWEGGVGCHTRQSIILTCPRYAMAACLVSYRVLQAVTNLTALCLTEPTGAPPSTPHATPGLAMWSRDSRL